MMKATAKKTAAARLPALDYRISFSGRELVLMSSSQKRVYTLPLEKLRPSIRIAHRLTGELQIDRRIILDHEIVLILSGKGILKMEPDDVTFATGDLLFIPPFTPHAFVSPTGAVSEHAAVHFDLAAEFPRFAANVLRRPPYEVRLAQGLVLPRHFKTRPADSIRAWLLELIPLFAQGDPLGRLRAEALLLHILTMLLDAPRATPAPEADGPINAALRFRIEKAIDHLENHFAEPMTPADLARAAGLSVSHFGRVFRRWAARSPGEYVLRRRVQEARKLLGDVSLSVKEVAARCGFEDPYYFSRVFRRIDGLAPTHFRQARLAGARSSGSVSLDSIE